MLVAAALVPPTVLLVPGAAGRAEVLAEERAAAIAAVTDLLAVRPDRVVLVVGTDPDRAGPHRPWHPGNGPRGASATHPSLAAAGIPGRGPGEEPAVAVGYWLLDQAGGAEAEVVLAAGNASVGNLRALGGRAGGADRVAMLAVGGFSARRGQGAPLPTDPRAAAVDDAMAAWWSGTGPEVPGDLARALAVSAWAPMHVLAGAPAEPTSPDLRLVTWPFGATYAVATRLPRAGG